MRAGVYLLLLCLCLTACAGGIQAPSTAPEPTPTFVPRPYPWTTPLPPEEPTPIDGTYRKIDPKQATPFPCARCPDYKPEGGEWRLTFERGAFEIEHTVTGWHSLGSYTVEGETLYLFNDPTCHREVGRYRWVLEEGQLFLEAIEDPCSTQLRGHNLSAQPWQQEGE